MWPNVRVKLDEPVNATRNPESKDELAADFEHEIPIFPTQRRLI